MSFTSSYQTKNITKAEITEKPILTKTECVSLFDEETPLPCKNMNGIEPYIDTATRALFVPKQGNYIISGIFLSTLKRHWLTQIYN